MEKTKNKYSTIDEYIEQFPPNIREKLQELRNIIKELTPASIEKISYQMPCFYLNGNLVYFAAYDKHIGFYPTNSGIEAFKDEFGLYKHSKGAVQFPVDEALPVELIKKIVKYRTEENTKK